MDIPSLGMLVTLIGFAIAILGMIIVMVGSMAGEKGERRVKGGGVLLIGPIPIIFGTDAKWTLVVIALALALMILSFILIIR